MKKQMLLLAAGAILLTGCKDDNQGPGTLKEQVFEGRGRLEIDYNDSEIAGKRVTVTPLSDMKARITFDSQVDLSTLNEAFKSIPPFPGPGVLPGSPSITLDLPLGTDGDEYSFSYKGETDFVTYTLHGKFDNNKMDVDFTDVRLKNQTFAGGAWAPMPADKNPLSDRQPFHIVWETTAPIQIPGLEGTVQDILRTLVNVPCIPVYNNTASMSLTQVIANGLRTLGMSGDGNMPVTYLQTANGASTFVGVPFGTFQYVPLSQYALKLYANPTDLLTLVLLNNTNRDPNIPDHPFGAPTRADGSLVDILMQMANTMKGMVAEGLPLACVRQDNSMALYANSELLLPLLKGYIVPILQNPVTRGIVEDYIDNNEALAQYKTAVMLLYDGLPLILDQTSKIELGLNFVKAK